jgi:hypothetical protein
VFTSTLPSAVKTLLLLQAYVADTIQDTLMTINSANNASDASLSLDFFLKPGGIPYREEVYVFDALDH